MGLAGGGLLALGVTTPPPIETLQQGVLQYNGVIMSTTASQINSVSIIRSTVCSSVYQRKKSKLRVTGLSGGIHRWPVLVKFAGEDIQVSFSTGIT